MSGRGLPQVRLRLQTALRKPNTENQNENSHGIPPKKKPRSDYWYTTSFNKLIKPELKTLRDSLHPPNFHKSFLKSVEMTSSEHALKAQSRNALLLVS
jgi:hypothetical protein